MPKIVLVGFPGAGKTKIGKRLARRLNLPFYDTDSLFEQKYQLSIPDFFQKYGENAFRICENAVLNEALALPDAVIATGGGTPCYFDAMEKINEVAVSIYIQLAPASLCTRLLNSHKVRPLTHGKNPAQMLEYVRETLISRENFYCQAKLIVKGEDLTLDSLISKLKIS